MAGALKAKRLCRFGSLNEKFLKKYTKVLDNYKTNKVNLYTQEEEKNKSQRFAIIKGNRLRASWKRTMTVAQASMPKRNIA